MNDILLKLITLLHTLLIIFLAVTPLQNSNYFLMLHFITVPFLFMHWICNDNTCVLTIVEKKLRKEVLDDDDKANCFTCRLIEPVYDFAKTRKNFRKIMYPSLIILWLLTILKFYNKYKTGEIKTIMDLFVL
jgi:hypothetical protein